MTDRIAERIEDWRGAIGRTASETRTIADASLRRYALALGLDGEADDVPLAHWAQFVPSPTDADLGEDGHPRRGGFLPAIALPRRMFAAATIAFDAPLVVGEEAMLTSTVADVAHKCGRAGDLVFVEVDRVVTQRGSVCVRERQSYVYRAMGDPVPLPAPRAEPAGERWEPDEVHLFRFSAATFNAHRIHYDRPYAIGVEGYPALVVHGPFTAAKLAGVAARRGPLARFAFRAQAPLFVGQPIFLHHTSATELCATRCDGTVAMTAEVTYR